MENLRWVTFFYPHLNRIVENNRERATDAWKDSGNGNQHNETNKREEKEQYRMESEYCESCEPCHFSAESDERLMRCMCCFPESIYAVRTILVGLSAHPSLSTASWANEEVYKPNRVSFFPFSYAPTNFFVGFKVQFAKWYLESLSSVKSLLIDGFWNFLF